MNQYTVKDLMEIVEKSAFIGVSRIEIGGISFVFDQENAPKIGLPAPENNPQGVEYFCVTHKDNDVRDSQFKEGDIYCYDCHLDRKQKQWKQKKTW